MRCKTPYRGTAAEFTKLAAEFTKLGKLAAEFTKLAAEFSKLAAEFSKLGAEFSKLDTLTRVSFQSEAGWSEYATRSPWTSTAPEPDTRIQGGLGLQMAEYVLGTPPNPAQEKLVSGSDYMRGRCEVGVIQTYCGYEVFVCTTIILWIFAPATEIPKGKI